MIPPCGNAGAIHTYFKNAKMEAGIQNRRNFTIFAFLF